VVGDGAGEDRRDPLDLQDVDQERHQLVGALCQVLGALRGLRLVGEQRRVVLVDHAGAGSRRRHHVVEAREGVDHPARHRPGVGQVPGVEGRLPAAGLRRRHLDGAAGILQQLDRGEADGRAVEVDQAGDEQADARTGTRHGRAPD